MSTHASHQWAAFAVAAAVGMIVFFDWVPPPLNHNIDGADVGARRVGALRHVPISGS